MDCINTQFAKYKECVCVCVAYLRVGLGGEGGTLTLTSSSLSEGEETNTTEDSLYSPTSNNSLTGSPLLGGRLLLPMRRNRAVVEG